MQSYQVCLSSSKELCSYTCLIFYYVQECSNVLPEEERSSLDYQMMSYLSSSNLFILDNLRSISSPSSLEKGLEDLKNECGLKKKAV